MTLNYGRDSEEAARYAKKGCDAAADATVAIGEAFSESMGKEHADATIYGDSEQGGVVLGVPLLWWAFAALSDSKLPPFLMIIVGVIILIVALRISSYFICLGNGIVFGIYIGYTNESWLYGIITTVVVYLILAIMAQKTSSRQIGQLVVFIAQITMMLKVAGAF